MIIKKLLPLIVFSFISFTGYCQTIEGDISQTVNDKKGTETDTQEQLNTVDKDTVDSVDQDRTEGLYADIKTNKGTIVLALEFEKAPMTVANFIGLAEGKIENKACEPGVPYYDGTIFHRVIPDFMIQGGDPTGTGRGNPGYLFPDELDPSLRHNGPGILSMANAGPNTNGSQFFIIYKETPHLDGKHTVFGHVVEGMDVVNNIEMNDIIKKVTIIRVGEQARAFASDSNEALAAIQKIASEAKVKELQAKKKLKKETKKIKKDMKKKYPEAIETKSGLMYVVHKKGKGKKPSKGTRITVHYTGKLPDGTVFDSSVKRNRPFQFTVGEKHVIAGWDEAFLSMKKGEKRTLIIPPELGYGSSGAAGVIPPDAWLIFDVELIKF